MYTKHIDLKMDTKAFSFKSINPRKIHEELPQETIFLKKAGKKNLYDRGQKKFNITTTWNFFRTLKKVISIKTHFNQNFFSIVITLIGKFLYDISK